MPVDTAQFGQANLSTTEVNTETPMTQQGRAAAPGSIIDHVRFVKSLSELGTQRTETTNSDLAAAKGVARHRCVFPPTIFCVQEQFRETLNQT